MTVKMLIRELEKLPGYLDVFVWNEKEDQVPVTSANTVPGTALWPHRPTIKNCVVLE